MSRTNLHCCQQTKAKQKQLRGIIKVCVSIGAMVFLSFLGSIQKLRTMNDPLDTHKTKTEHILSDYANGVNVNPSDNYKYVQSIHSRNILSFSDQNDVDNQKTVMSKFTEAHSNDMKDTGIVVHRTGGSSTSTQNHTHNVFEPMIMDSNNDSNILHVISHALKYPDSNDQGTNTTTTKRSKAPIESHFEYDVKKAECREFHDKQYANMTVEDICVFVATVDDCQIDSGLIHYTLWVYCDQENNRAGVMILLAIWWVFLFIGLAVTAGDFFCPALGVISKTLHLSHNIAGVTFLAFGNGAPDIFSAITAIKSAGLGGNAGLAFGALFGGGMFVTTIVAGTIVMISPFQIMSRPFMRDVIFYIAASYWAFKTLWDHHISKYEALGFIVMYVVYVFVVVISRYIRLKYFPTTLTVLDFEHSLHPAHPQEYSVPSATFSVTHGVQQVHLQFAPEYPEDMGYTKLPTPDQLKEDSLLDHSRFVGMEFMSNPDADNSDNYFEHDPPAASHIKVFLHAINPIPMDEFKGQAWYGKIYDIIKAPFLFVLTITIPLVDYESTNANWNRYLSALQCVTGPVFSVFVINVAQTTLGPVFPVYGLVLILGAVLALIVLCTSKNDRPPAYHSAFAFLGFLVAIVWIYTIANEIVNLLKMFGIVFDIPNSVLGLTLLAWGNCVGDLITDILVARQGYPKIGISACFGGPLFNLLMGIGIPFTMLAFEAGHDVKLKVSFEDITMVGFLLLSLCSSLVIVVLSKFWMYRAYGAFLYFLYIAFLVVTLLCAFDYISVGEFGNFG